ncbi:MAG: hypothetical protein GXN93_04550 [Candidatus Diapherotrites archaeon]|nr:hypothetical protein [Candidatus Diapherotrites archaeon]
MERDLFTRAKKFAETAREGVQTPTVELQEHTLETSDIPTLWRKSGILFRKKYEVLGVDGTSIPRTDEQEGVQMISQHKVQLNGRPFVLEHMPAGVVDLPTGDRALVTYHLKDGDLTVVVHGVLPSDAVRPEEESQKIRTVAKYAIAGNAGESPLTMNYSYLTHEVIPLSREADRRLVSERIRQLLSADLESATKRVAADKAWKTIEEMHKTFRKRYGFDSAESGGKRSIKRSPKESDVLAGSRDGYLYVQKVLRENPEFFEKLGLQAVSSISQFQRELAWALARQGAPEYVDARRIRERILDDPSVINLSRWSAYPKIAQFALAYRKFIENAARRGKLKVNVIYRKG